MEATKRVKKTRQTSNELVGQLEETGRRPKDQNQQEEID